MKILNKMRSISLLVILLMVVMIAKPTMVMAGEETVNLGTTSTFAVLAGTTITNTGTTTISGTVGGEVDGKVGGDVGLFPGTAFDGQADVKISDGDVYISDAGGVAKKAKTDLVTAYDDAAGRKPVKTIPSELGGTTLKPGIYDSADGTFHVTGTLTLDAEGDPNAVFVFQSAKTLTTATDSNVKLENSARFCRTFWQVGSSATLGVNSNFVGHILAMVSITANTGAKVQGQLLARNGAVTLDSNTITNGYCATIQAPAPAKATLNVIKHVVNDNGGTKVASDFKLHVKSADNDDFTNSAPGAEKPGKSYSLNAGTYVVSEDSVAGYTASYSGDSDSKGKITLAPGEIKTVTITNDDIKVISSVNDSEQEEPKVTTTVTGGKLPDTSSHMYELLIMGAVLTILGALGWVSRRRFE